MLATDGDEEGACIDADAGDGKAYWHVTSASVESHQHFGPHRAAVVGAAVELKCVETSDRDQRLLQQSVVWPSPRGALDADISDAAKPMAALAAQIVESGKGLAVEEAGLYVADGALDLSLGARPVVPVPFGLEAIMAA